jgi:lipoprotein-anchoring transpeptidase ErfK/SrfK
MASRNAILVGLMTAAALSLAPAQAQQAQQPAAKQPAAKQPQPSTSGQADTMSLNADVPMGRLDTRAYRSLALQVALDRAGFSPGELDGAAGANTRRALQAFRDARGLPLTGELDDRTIEILGEPFRNPIATYAISADDVAGPFVEDVPADMMKKAELPALAYTSVTELLAERFHASPKLLDRLNPKATFARGEVIYVPNVDAFVAPSEKPAAQPATKAAPQERASGNATKTGGEPGPASEATRAASAPPSAGSPTTNVVTVTDQTKTLTVQNAAGETIFQAPVTVGSANDPLPAGEWKVNGVSLNPPFNYNPDLFWDANPAHAKAKIAPGPNNPVGVVWIDLSKEHYGIHGTPEPSRIGYAQSHGCIRLTNWDAMRVAALVGPGTKVILR